MNVGWFRFMFDENETGLEGETGLHEDKMRPDDDETRLTDDGETRLTDDGETIVTDVGETGWTDDFQTRWMDGWMTMKPWMDEVETEGR